MDANTQAVIAPYQKTLPGRFPVRVEGYALTDAGRFTYCLNCTDREDE